VLNNYLIKLVRLATMIDAYIKIIQRDPKQKVVEMIYNGELKIQKMKLN
jgi:hypothetical protein